MTNNKNNQNIRFFPATKLREHLREQALAAATRIARSVGRLTSCDELPCEEYDEEVAYQQELVRQMLYFQNCRTAVEKCIAGGSATVRYRWSDGTVTVTKFRKADLGRIRVIGLNAA